MKLEYIIYSASTYVLALSLGTSPHQCPYSKRINVRFCPYWGPPPSIPLFTAPHTKCAHVGHEIKFPATVHMPTAGFSKNMSKFPQNYFTAILLTRHHFKRICKILLF
jgi:hypothetical protein